MQKKHSMELGHSEKNPCPAGENIPTSKWMLAWRINLILPKLSPKDIKLILGLERDRQRQREKEERGTEREEGREEGRKKASKQACGKLPAKQYILPSDKHYYNN